MNYLFIGSAPLFYPDVAGPDGSLIALPGDVVEFPDGGAPNDGKWIETDLLATDTSGRSWPLKPAAAEAAAPEPETAPEPDSGQPLSLPLEPHDQELG